ncbi:MAG TPA: ADP-ribosylglycohydrolase family protein [Bacteroidales bacterium]|jgi:ADP-ribosylglycohydrolase|nr:ADP-ribosylglycohydrolase family protein [Bacteroidales bacterium]
MLGAVIGDIIGSTYEFRNTGNYEFDPFPPKSFFTDDTVLTVAIADAIMNKTDYAAAIREYALNYPGRGYGGWFNQWIHLDNPKPYNSFGNGSAMRVSPVGWAFDTLGETIREAEKSAAVTHNHREGKKGAKVVAAAIFLARTGHGKKEIKEFIEKSYSYNLSRTLADIKPFYSFNETCQKTVPEALICFLESVDFEDAIRKAIWLGGDSDTLACITGGIAEAFYRDIPSAWIENTYRILDEKLKHVIDTFRNVFCNRAENPGEI